MSCCSIDVGRFAELDVADCMVEVRPPVSLCIAASSEYYYDELFGLAQFYLDGTLVRSSTCLRKLITPMSYMYMFCKLGDGPSVAKLRK